VGVGFYLGRIFLGIAISVKWIALICGMALAVLGNNKKFRQASCWQ
jgi:hypothetical protein